MGYQTRLIPLLKTVLLFSVLATGYVSIVATDTCLSTGDDCTSDGDCCSGHCEDGQCCRGIGADLDSDDPPSDCCSGEIRDGTHGPYCCGTEGMVVSSADRCCVGLTWVPADGTCTTCPSPCYWRSEPDVVGVEPECVCPDDDDIDVPPPLCSTCADLTESDCWMYTVYHEGYYGPELILGQGCRVYGPFYAPDADSAEICARRAAEYEGFSHDWAWVVEEYTGYPSPPCVR